MKVHETTGSSDKQQELLTTPEVAEQWRVCSRTVTYWREKGLPFIKLGRAVRFLPSDIEAYIKRHRIGHDQSS
jgi:excisionase family DNA binding protein